MRIVSFVTAAEHYVMRQSDCQVFRPISVHRTCIALWAELISPGKSGGEWQIRLDRIRGPRFRGMARSTFNVEGVLFYQLIGCAERKLRGMTRSTFNVEGVLFYQLIGCAERKRYSGWTSSVRAGY